MPPEELDLQDVAEDLPHEAVAPHRLPFVVLHHRRLDLLEVRLAGDLEVEVDGPVVLPPLDEVHPVAASGLDAEAAVQVDDLALDRRLHDAVAAQMVPFVEPHEQVELDLLEELVLDGRFQLIPVPDQIIRIVAHVDDRADHAQVVDRGPQLPVLLLNRQFRDLPDLLCQPLHSCDLSFLHRFLS